MIKLDSKKIITGVEMLFKMMEDFLLAMFVLLLSILLGDQFNSNPKLALDAETLQFIALKLHISVDKINGVIVGVVIFLSTLLVVSVIRLCFYLHLNSTALPLRIMSHIVKITVLIMFIRRVANNLLP